MLITAAAATVNPLPHDSRRLLQSSWTVPIYWKHKFASEGGSLRSEVGTHTVWVSEGQKKALEKSSPILTLDYRILLFSFSASELQLLSDSKEAQSSLLPKNFSLKALILNMSKDPWSLEGSYVHHYTTKANNSSCYSFGFLPWFLLCSSISSFHNHQEGCNTGF